MQITIGWLAMLPDDPGATAEEIRRRREGLGFSSFVLGADRGRADGQ